MRRARAARPGGAQSVQRGGPVSQWGAPAVGRAGFRPGPAAAQEPVGRAWRDLVGAIFGLWIQTWGHATGRDAAAVMRASGERERTGAGRGRRRGRRGAHGRVPAPEDRVHPGL